MLIGPGCVLGRTIVVYEDSDPHKTCRTISHEFAEGAMVNGDLDVPVPCDRMERNEIARRFEHLYAAESASEDS